MLCTKSNSNDVSWILFCLWAMWFTCHTKSSCSLKSCCNHHHHQHSRSCCFCFDQHLSLFSCETTTTYYLCSYEVWTCTSRLFWTRRWFCTRDDFFKSDENAQIFIHQRCSDSVSWTSHFYDLYTVYMIKWSSIFLKVSLCFKALWEDLRQLQMTKSCNMMQSSWDWRWQKQEQMRWKSSFSLTQEKRWSYKAKKIEKAQAEKAKTVESERCLQSHCAELEVCLTWCMFQFHAHLTLLLSSFFKNQLQIQYDFNWSSFCRSSFVRLI